MPSIFIDEQMANVQRSQLSLTFPGFLIALVSPIQGVERTAASPHTSIISHLILRYFADRFDVLEAMADAVLPP